MNYTAVAKKVQKALSKFGKPAVLRRKVGGTFDPTIGQNVGGVSTDYSCHVLEESFQGITLNSDSIEVGSGIHTGGLKFTVSTEAPEPIAGTDLLIVGSKSYLVDAVKPLRPGVVPLYWEVRAKT